MLKGYKVSRHLIQDRTERVEKIGKYVGFGTELFSVKDNRENCEFVVTTTGVLLVCRGNFIITMICPDFQRMASVHKMAGREMTSGMIEQVKKNEKKAKRLGFQNRIDKSLSYYFFARVRDV